ncbi:hypothetical protein [Leifsonia sp. SIMBA_070]|uniref:hypothetical protein n=1 Tax=Leifsonia sp. SIMBA_070 TaxID=3085810 RepID=UPI00397C72D0
MDTHAPPRPRYGYWLLVSVPLAVLLDVIFGGLARFTWCGFNTCLYQPGDPTLSISFLCGIAVITFLAVVLPPWTPGWHRPVVAGVIGLVIAGVAALFVFQPR